MREVDSSETSVVWPAWCYSGETVNEDLPQATPASLLLQHQQQHQQRFLLQQSSSNQSQSSSSSSSASSSPSSHLVPGQGAGKLSTSSGGKRKSITSPTSPGPHQSPALTGASSALATAAAAAAAAFQASPRRSNPPTPTSAGLQLALVAENGNGRRGSPSSNPSTPTHDDGGHYSPLNNNNNISSSNFNNQVAALQSLDKMLSERMYDRKKFLNSPTAGSAAAAAAAAAAASSFYEKLRNGAAEMELNQLNLIKNGQSPSMAASDLSAIGSNNGSGSGSNGGLLVTANGTSSSGGIGGNSGSALGADGNSGNSLSNNNNQNSSNVNNASSSSSSGSIGNNSNNNSIKSERFSPTNNDVQSTASRSRSVTPSSFSGTPPQTMHATDVAYPSSISTSGLLPSPNSAMGSGRHEFQARNYSDIMRSLAAKYHNNNNSPGTNNSNDQSSMKNPFLEPKMRINQPKSFTDGPLLGSKKSSPITSTQVPNPSIMSSLFPGLPFQSSVFPPLIDMSSTQALVALARAAKESGIHNLLKPEDGGLKKPSAGSRSSSPPLGATSLASHFPSPFPTRYLPGILPNHLSASYPTSVQPTTTTTAVPAISPLKSPSRPTEGLSTFPLDLSSAAGAPSAAKRIKLSPTPSRNQETSPAPSSTNSQPSDSMELKLGLPRKCHARIEEISAWTVDNVCDFVGSIDICAEYVQNFRDQSIDGAGLPLLTEEHLTNSLGMKLGPALKLKSMLAKKLGGPCPCALCAAPTPTRSSSSKGDTTPTNRPPSNGSVG
ncbi:flocculation protein FLO11 isoform X2 [Aedes aegypti]|uniref:SAM domain-containing protein n=1 Tax=Aedes aegypti TaxID=7159 RepID=A0A6I8TSX1_AEDAE|nr:flocculation protein FLO11 isoform X2 [Aedes aegypti]XP_021701108.1 flocculation protein FLO11 isoform X2 [Aedes aegypti]